MAAGSLPYLTMERSHHMLSLVDNKERAAPIRRRSKRASTTLGGIVPHTSDQLCQHERGEIAMCVQ
jgi:hypothetical protein